MPKSIKRSNRRGKISKRKYRRDKISKRRQKTKKTYRKRNIRKIRRKSKSRRLRGGGLTDKMYEELDSKQKGALVELGITEKQWDNEKQRVFLQKVAESEWSDVSFKGAWRLLDVRLPAWNAARRLVEFSGRSIDQMEISSVEAEAEEAETCYK